MIPWSITRMHINTAHSLKHVRLIGSRAGFKLGYFLSRDADSAIWATMLAVPFYDIISCFLVRPSTLFHKLQGFYNNLMSITITNQRLQVPWGFYCIFLCLALSKWNPEHNLHLLLGCFTTCKTALEEMRVV